MNVHVKYTTRIIGYVLYVYVMCFFLLTNDMIPYDVRPNMSKSRFFFSYTCRPYEGLPNFGEVTVIKTEFYYYLFYPIDIFANINSLKE